MHVSTYHSIFIIAVISSVSVSYGRRVMTNLANIGTSTGHKAYHPGHPPHHVTRLHRYDHSGLASMLEAEASWSHDVQRLQRGEEWLKQSIGRALKQVRHIRGAVDAIDGTWQEVPEESSFLQVSEQQAAALQEHHHAWSSFLQLLAAEVGDGIYEKVIDADADGSMEDHGIVTEAGDTSSNSTKDVITTGLSNLNSQYVGPIGVGTHTDCTRFDSASSFLNQTANSSKQEGETCQATDQSKVWVVFDTGSTNIWINSDLCETGPCRLPGRHMYNHSASDTFLEPDVQNHVSVQFGTGKIDGPQAKEDFRIGPFIVKEQTFNMIQNATGSVFKEVAFEGIVGLAFPKMSANGVVPFFDTVINQKALDHNEFAFYLSKDTPSANAIFWGGVDKTFYKGELEYFPVVDPFYWALKLVSFKIGEDEIMGSEDEYVGSANEDRTWNGPLAIVDTGTTFFTLEKGKFKSVMAKLPRVKCADITSETHPPMTITLESSSGHERDFVLSHKQYMASNHKGKDAKCSPAFMQVDLPEEHGVGMILGEVFLRHYFAVFDRGSGDEQHARVALAEAADHDSVHTRLHHLTSGQPSFGDAKAPIKDPE